MSYYEPRRIKRLIWITHEYIKKVHVFYWEISRNLFDMTSGKNVTFERLLAHTRTRTTSGVSLPYCVFHIYCERRVQNQYICATLRLMVKHDRFEFSFKISSKHDHRHKHVRFLCRIPSFFDFERITPTDTIPGGLKGPHNFQHIYF